jgi:FeS assembly protein SufD
VVSLSERETRGVRGPSKAALDALIATHGEGAIPAQMRYDALARFEELPVRQVIRGGRNWKHDLSKLDLSGLDVLDAVRADGSDEPDATVAVHSAGLTATASAVPSDSTARGVIVTVFDGAKSQFPDIFTHAFGEAVDTRDDKFASLALAFQHGGTFVWVPDGVHVDEPIEIRYEFSGATFPYTLIALGSGASATIVERIKTRDESVRGDGLTSFLCGIAEIVVGERASLRYTIVQSAGATARAILTRRAKLEKDASLALALAEIGSEHVVERIRIVENAHGGNLELTGFFFANADQHVDLETEVIHAAGNTRSQTLIRSAGTERGQGRYVGNIKILKDAHGADASLRDDALLLSQEAHVDSVPALEIAANDVKAFHGATVGAISEDEIFYAQTRGLERAEAERMIALGFFEPAIARFPGDALREELRAALQAKLESRAP